MSKLLDWYLQRHWVVHPGLGLVIIFVTTMFLALFISGSHNSQVLMTDARCDVVAVENQDGRVHMLLTCAQEGATTQARVILATDVVRLLNEHARKAQCVVYGNRQAENCVIIPTP